MDHCRFIPPYLLAHVAGSHVDVEVSRCGHSTLAIDERLRSRRTSPPPRLDGVVAPRSESGQDAWTIHTADNGSDLPGRAVRSSGEPASGDAAVDEAYAGVEASLALFREVLGRDSYDGRGAPVVATVHYERNYDNAFWDGRQLVFGDGDGKVFGRFTRPVDVLAHEFTHAVTQYTSGFTYSGQPGALNESVSDVFASCVKQRLLGQTALEADWLVGEGIFLPGVHGRALRSMAEPGTAYDDPVLGKDPQVGSMDDYVDTDEDNGGVHLNSGIPNRAFYLAATGLASAGLAAESWAGAGRVWYAALTSGPGPEATFADFAAATVAAAQKAGAEIAAVVASAWEKVGVAVPLPGGAATADTARVGTTAASDGGGGSGADTVEVRRSGGFAGMQVSGAVVLGDDPKTAEVEQLIARIDLAAVPHGLAEPDRFVYVFRIRGEEATVPEQSLTPELERLAALVLER
jgi:hypothetical protein